ncbi:MAG: DUF6675 family protein [Treponema sp.]
MMKKKLTVCCITILFYIGTVFSAYAADAGGAKSYTLENVVKEPYLSQLKSERKIRFVHNQNDLQLKLLPESAYSDRVAANKVEKKSGYITECLYLVNKDDIGKKKTDGTGSDTSMTSIAHILRSISKMEGMEYYSNFYKKTLVLYSRTYMIAGPDDDTPVSDKNTGNADGQIVYTYQHDHTFGGCKYVINYYQSANEIYATFNNITKMMFGIIKAVDPHQFRANMLIMDCGQQYLVYISTDIGCPRVEMIDRQINNAFNDRLDALYTWFISQF